MYNILTMDTWEMEIQAEFEKAEQARTRGNEGQARVCARRAAGIAVRQYLARQRIQPVSPSAYDLLNRIKDDLQLSPRLRNIADHLTLRVSEEFKLPGDIDLVAEAREFCKDLFYE